MRKLPFFTTAKAYTGADLDLDKLMPMQGNFEKQDRIRRTRGWLSKKLLRYGNAPDTLAQSRALWIELRRNGYSDEWIITILGPLH